MILLRAPLLRLKILRLGAANVRANRVGKRKIPHPHGLQVREENRRSHSAVLAGNGLEMFAIRVMHVSVGMPRIAGIISRVSAPMMKTVLVSLLVNSPPVSTPAPPSPVVTMLSVSRRIMLPGAGARWDTRRMLMASVPPCVMV